MAVREAGGDPLLTLDDQIHKFVAFLHTPSLPDSPARTRNRCLPGSSSGGGSDAMSFELKRTPLIVGCGRGFNTRKVHLRRRFLNRRMPDVK